MSGFMEEIQEVWFCTGCNAEYENYDEANDCCEPTKMYKCPGCSETFLFEDSADKHFDEVCNNEAYLAKKQRQVLESAGQGRLFNL